MPRTLPASASCWVIPCAPASDVAARCAGHERDFLSQRLLGHALLLFVLPKVTEALRHAW
jgi:hypothetical protein